MAIKSYTNQKNAKARPAKPRILNLTCPVALPNNISDKVQDQIFEVLNVTPFKALSIAVCAYSKDVRDPGFERKDGKPVRDDKPVNIGYIRKYDPKTNTFTISIMERYVRFVEGFINPAVEVAYAETYYGEFKNINRFNLIALGPNNYSSEDDEEAEAAIEEKPIGDRYPKPNSVPLHSTKSPVANETPAQVVEEDFDDEEEIEEEEKLLEIDDSVGVSDSVEVAASDEVTAEEVEAPVEEKTEVAAKSETEPAYEETRYIDPPEKKDPFQVTIGDVVNHQ